MTELQERIWNVLMDLDGQHVAGILVDVHGAQILNEDVLDEIKAEGLIDEESEDDSMDDLD